MVCVFILTLLIIFEHLWQFVIAKFEDNKGKVHSSVVLLRLTE